MADSLKTTFFVLIIIGYHFVYTQQLQLVALLFFEPFLFSHCRQSGFRKLRFAC